MSQFHTRSHGTFALGLVALTVVALSASGIAAASDESTVSVTISVAEPQVTRTGDGHEVFTEDFGRLLIPGKPSLPSKIFAIAIPPGATMTDVTFKLGDGVVLPGRYEIAPVPLPRVIGQEDPQVRQGEERVYAENHNAVYSQDAVYPEQAVEFVRTAGYRKYSLADVRVTPFAYRPQSGQLTYYPSVTVHAHYAMPDTPVTPMLDDLARTEQVAREIIVNYDQATSWYPRGPANGRGLHDFVIITVDSLLTSVSPLVTWETAKGRTVEVVTTSWINANYTGRDLAQKMRNFLREKYPTQEWGIEDVLLIGHYDDVPMRRTYQDVGYGRPETDFYYAELSLPDSESWDANNNRLYGDNGDPIDFYSEVNVGRIPWTDSATVQHICEKSVAYEQNDDPAFKQNILLLGAFFWDDDPYPRTDTAVLNEAIADQSWMSDWTMTRMYEWGYSNYPSDYNLWRSNVVSQWSSGTFAFVNYAGHGSPTSSHRYHNGMPAFIDSAACQQLNDEYPAIMFADACSNSDTDHLNIGQAMLKQGGIGFLGATKVAYGMSGWDDPMDGSTQSLDYFFATSVTSTEYTQGAGHQWAMRQMYTYGLWSAVKYETFEWGAFWGNPNLSMGVPIEDPCPGDLDGDGQTGQSDLGILLGDWGCTGGDCAGDLDGDGETGQSDLGILLADWGCGA